MCVAHKYEPAKKREKDKSRSKKYNNNKVLNCEERDENNTRILNKNKFEMKAEFVNKINV